MNISSATSQPQTTTEAGTGALVKAMSGVELVAKALEASLDAMSQIGSIDISA